MLNAIMPYIHLVLAMLAMVVVEEIVFSILRDRHDPDAIKNVVLRTLAGPARLAAALLGAEVAIQGIQVSAGARQVLEQLASLALIATIGWALMAGIRIVSDVTRARYHAVGADDLLIRKLETRVDVVGRVLVVFIVLVTAGAMLMTIPGVRALGTSILASAGVLGIIAGLAAQPLLTNLFAGLQIAITQPIRLQDVVVVSAPTSSSSYWGQVEEINAAFVVVRVWDNRRLIMPLSYMLAQPFENWTFRTADLLGYVMIYADYRVDVDAVRAELKRILDQSPDWDRQTWNLQVTQLSAETVTLRALFSAPNSSIRWNLIVRVQEQLIKFMQQHYPESLPRMRVEVATAPESGGQSGHGARAVE